MRSGVRTLANLNAEVARLGADRLGDEAAFCLEEKRDLFRSKLRGRAPQRFQVREPFGDDEIGGRKPFFKFVRGQVKNRAESVAAVRYDGDDIGQADLPRVFEERVVNDRSAARHDRYVSTKFRRNQKLDEELVVNDLSRVIRELKDRRGFFKRFAQGVQIADESLRRRLIDHARHALFRYIFERKVDRVARDREPNRRFKRVGRIANPLLEDVPTLKRESVKTFLFLVVRVGVSRDLSNVSVDDRTRDGRRRRQPEFEIRSHRFFENLTLDLWVRRRKSRRLKALTLQANDAV